MSKYLLVIKADTNDGDYVHRVKEIDIENKKEFNFERLEKVANAIKNCENGYNWLTGDCKRDDEPGPRELYKDVLTEEEIQWFDELKPYGEYGTHTIENIVLYEINEKISLL